MRKRNGWTIIFLLIMIVSIIIGIMKFDDNKKIQIKDSERRIEECLEYDNDYPSDGMEYLCNYLLENDMHYVSFSETTTEIRTYMPLSINNFITIFLVVFCSCYYVCRYFKSNMISNDITRENYFTIVKGLFLNAWKSVFVLPITILILFTFSYLYCGNLDFVETMSSWQSSTVANGMLFVFSLFIVPFLACLIYSNISLIVSRKQHNWILAVIMSYITIIGVDLFFEIIIRNVFDKLVSYGSGIVFNIVAFFPYNDSYGCYPSLLLFLSLAIITTIILILVYRDKEKMLIDCEANR